jgi:hypothetical protein
LLKSTGVRVVEINGSDPLDFEEIIMRRDLLHAAVLIGVLSVSGAVSAQTTIIGGTGSIFRYHGDTIRLERDTTVTITIYRGDTVLTSSSVNGALRYEVSYVVRGDSAWVIDVRTANGAVPARLPRRQPNRYNGLPDVRRGFRQANFATRPNVRKGDEFVSHRPHAICHDARALEGTGDFITGGFAASPEVVPLIVIGTCESADPRCALRRNGDGPHRTPANIPWKIHGMSACLARNVEKR